MCCGLHPPERQRAFQPAAGGAQTTQLLVLKGDTKISNHRRPLNPFVHAARIRAIVHASRNGVASCKSLAVGGLGIRMREIVGMRMVGAMDGRSGGARAGCDVSRGAMSDREQDRCGRTEARHAAHGFVPHYSLGLLGFSLLNRMVT